MIDVLIPSKVSIESLTDKVNELVTEYNNLEKIVSGIDAELAVIAENVFEGADPGLDS